MSNAKKTHQVELTTAQMIELGEAIRLAVTGLELTIEDYGHLMHSNDPEEQAIANLKKLGTRIQDMLFDSVTL